MASRPAKYRVISVEWESSTSSGQSARRMASQAGASSGRADRTSTDTSAPEERVELAERVDQALGFVLAIELPNRLSPDAARWRELSPLRDDRVDPGDENELQPAGVGHRVHRERLGEVVHL